MYSRTYREMSYIWGCGTLRVYFFVYTQREYAMEDIQLIIVLFIFVPHTNANWTLLLAEGMHRF